MTHSPIQAREISACLINSEKNKTPGQEVKAAQITEIYTKIEKNAHNYGKEF